MSDTESDTDAQYETNFAGTESNVLIPDDVPTNENGNELLPNFERGCNYLKQDNAYLRSEPSADGTIPPFVEFRKPIPYLESQYRGFKELDGLAFELSVTPLAAPTDTDDRGVQHWEYPDDHNALTETIPAGEVENHLERLTDSAPDGLEHAGEIPAFEASDLIMFAGKSHYPTPADYINEVLTLGLSKAIPITDSTMPVINPNRTRLFVIHPNAIGTAEELENDEGLPGIIGYAYVGRLVYTENREGQVPKWVQDKSAAGYLDVVDTGEEIAEDDDRHPANNPDTDLGRHKAEAEAADEAVDVEAPTLTESVAADDESDESTDEPEAAHAPLTERERLYEVDPRDLPWEATSDDMGTLGDLVVSLAEGDAVTFNERTTSLEVTGIDDMERTDALGEYRQVERIVEGKRGGRYLILAHDRGADEGEWTEVRLYRESGPMDVERRGSVDSLRIHRRADEELMWERMNFNDLRSMVKVANEKRDAGIEVGQNPSKADLIEALVRSNATPGPVTFDNGGDDE